MLVISKDGMRCEKLEKLRRSYAFNNKITSEAEAIYNSIISAQNDDNKEFLQSFAKSEYEAFLSNYIPEICIIYVNDTKFGEFELPMGNRIFHEIVEGLKSDLAVFDMCKFFTGSEY